ncbi:MAG: alpha/beta fold hydrolase [Bdellovibrionaceae bacterium]|nr:alpha/beta fold hydrolase [Pseudobdellovibrionaceae bacterium]
MSDLKTSWGLKISWVSYASVAKDTGKDARADKNRLGKSSVWSRKSVVAIVAKLFGFSVVSLLLVGCNDVGGGFATVQETMTVDVPIIRKVTKENYMNGQQFCQKFVNTGDSKTVEIGKWIDVPYNYSESSKTIQIYAYTKKAFNPSLPTYIFVDGGPGQNTHSFSGVIEDEFNEIHFDQRGVGCSAPNTWDEYMDPGLYSSQYTTNDIDEVRKAYGVDMISVYGISYGTVPATIYGSKFKNHVKAIVLEGVVGQVENLARYTRPVEKYNLILDSLNSEQKNSFDRVLMGSDEEKRFVVMYLLGTAGYSDGGYRTVRDVYFKQLFPVAGGIDEGAFQRALKRIFEYENPYKTPQHPGAVDENVLIRFYCKELGGFSKDKFDLNYSRTRGFYEEETRLKKKWAADCEEQGITRQMEDIYDERKYPINTPVYYFQGSHDGATIAEGALNHLKYVPQKKSYFLLSIKGGHNPALSKIKSSDKAISEIHKKLFIEALSAQVISLEFVKQLNAPILGTNDDIEKKFKFVTWKLYTGDLRASNKANLDDIQKEFGGLRRIAR